MIIKIEHFTCTALAKQNILPPELNLTSNEKEALDLIAFYESTQAEYRSEVEQIFDELTDHVNLTRLVALKLLKYQADKYTYQSIQPEPVVDDSFDITSDHPVYSNDDDCSEIISSPVDLEATFIDSVIDFTDEPNTVSTQENTPTAEANPILDVVMGTFDK